MGEGLTVSQAAKVLGTSPQTVRALLRKGELRGEQKAWGSRYVWEVSSEGLDEFLAAYGRLDGHRRSRTAPAAPDSLESLLAAAATPAPARVLGRWPFRVRHRATLVVLLTGLPLLVAYAVARLLPEVLWFQEIGRTDVLGRVVAARVELYALVCVPVALLVGSNLALALRGTDVVRSPVGRWAVVAGALMTGSVFASATQHRWPDLVLWQHRQSFGVSDPVHGRDVGFFVFTLPVELLAWAVVAWTVLVTAALVLMVAAVRGRLGVRPLRAAFGVQVHLASLAAVLLLSVAWRIHLERYLLELGQPAPGDTSSFAGAGFVDVNVRDPGLVFLALVTVTLALMCLAAPFLARAGHGRRARRLVLVPGAVLVLGAVLLGTLLPAVVQRFVVDPDPLLSEQPYLERSIAATRAALALDTVDVEAYRPSGSFEAADFPPLRKRLAGVPEWDAWVLEARLRQLVTDRPFYRPTEPVLDVPVEGPHRPTLVSIRQLDLDQVPGAGTWVNDRLAYTHGVGRIRFSGTDVTADRQPRLLREGSDLVEPRIYFGPHAHTGDDTDAEAVALLTPGADDSLTGSPWVLVRTRRPEVDLPATHAADRAAYHYDGPAGVALTDWVRRTAFALALGSKELLLSDDVTPDSRLLLHRDVHERLRAVAPFITWDQDAVPLTADGRIVFVVEGYTTTENYPYAERVPLGATSASYARASVRATIDAFTGRIEIYLTDPAEPIARAWTAAFPDLFGPETDLPPELRSRLRYPEDLFAAQATAFERFHATRPDVFVSEAEAWARPLALSGPIEVAGDVDFDESDEDDLRLTLQPGYKLSSPPDGATPRLLLETYFSPRGGQNLVSSLTGWVDDQGRARLAARSLPRQPVTLGPAQMSRLTFATARVRNLLGIRNLEIRDLAASSLDTVLLGRPRLLFLPAGVLQLQSLYEGSRGPGAARLLGVTAFLDGRVGLGPDVESAVRQALNEPPELEILPPERRLVPGRVAELGFRVANARRAVVTITSADGRQTARRRLSTGRTSVEFAPRSAGRATMVVEVSGLDGTSVTDRRSFRVLHPRPRIRLGAPPRGLVVGEPVEVPFRVVDAVRASVTVSTDAGVVFDRRFLLRGPAGVATWVPRDPGRAVLAVRAHGPGGRAARETLRLDVAPRPPEVPPPTVELLRLPTRLTVDDRARIAVRADGCRTTVVQIRGADTESRRWRFACPVRRGALTWTPRAPGRYVLTAAARAGDTSAQVTAGLEVRRRAR